MRAMRLVSVFFFVFVFLCFGAVILSRPFKSFCSVRSVFYFISVQKCDQVQKGDRRSDGGVMGDVGGG